MPPDLPSAPSEWIRHKAEYTASLGMTTVRMEIEAGNLSGALHALARIAEREEREADRGAVERLAEEVERLREALEIAHNALERTNRDTAFGYEDKKAAEDYIRSVLKGSHAR